MDVEEICRFDAEEVAYAVVHEMHKYSDIFDEQRLDCGYCSRDNWHNKESKWRKEWDKRLLSRKNALLQKAKRPR